MTTSPTFDISGPLPRGRTAIEASAGTGKTYTLASLALRYVAEQGLSIDQLLLVTFTHSAADDLRDRVRRRFAEAHAVLLDPSATTDELLHQLAASDREARLTRVQQALTDFDAATITTIHGFATQVLAGQGATASTSADAELIGTEEELIWAVCTDVLARSALEITGHDAVLPTLREFAGVVNDIRNNPGIYLTPAAASDAPPSAQLLRRLVDSALVELRQRHQNAGTLSYTDVLTELRDLLMSSPGAVEALQRRFKVALIDEFQDTDPVQWEFLSLVFGDPASDQTLVLVGDPKQSIYSFRGADLHTYLRAAFAPNTAHSTLVTNWRSDAALLDGLAMLFSGATFGDDNIGFVPVSSTPANAEARIRTIFGTALPALSIRLAIGPDLRRQSGPTRDIYADAASEAIINDLADTIRDHLERSEIPDREHASTTGVRRVEASDIAVLIAANNEGPAIQSALRDRGVPAVIVRGSSVLTSSAEGQWRELLVALGRPGDTSRARSAALGWFFGWSATELASATDEQIADLHDQLFSWASTLERDGADEFFARLHSESQISQRLLATASGERDLTDLRHIASLLRSTSDRQGRSAVGLLATLDRLRRDDAHSTTDDDLFARQIESDARAVQIMTVHRAKGLEFPIVCVPSLYRGIPSNQGQSFYFDPATQRRTYDLVAKTPDKALAANTSSALARVEAQWENLRQLYVAVTRAQHQTVIWWSPTQNNSSSGLAHMLFAREDGRITKEQLASANAASPTDPAATKELLESVFHDEDGAVSITVVGAPHGPGRRLVATPSDTQPGRLQAAELRVAPDRSSARLSFSAIAAHGGRTAFDPDDDSLGDAGANDEVTGDDAAEETDAADTSSDLPLGGVAGSARFGTLVHNILQRIDFSAPDLDGLLLRHVAEQRRLTPWNVSDEVLVAGLRAAIDSPLGPIAHGKRLRDFAPADHLNELTFELRFGPAARVATVRDMGSLISAHLASDDPFLSWGDQLRDGRFDLDLSGHLTGSIDLVLRVRGEDGARDRYVISDYKTNRLGPFDRDSQSIDYHPSLLPTAMIEHDYPLQALLYSVALHRYLRWRLRDYDPAVHLGGAAYLFIRGMSGAETPLVGGLPHGVFPWNIPAALVSDLSDLFERGRP